MKRRGTKLPRRKGQWRKHRRRLGKLPGSKAQQPHRAGAGFVGLFASSFSSNQRIESVFGKASSHK